MPPNPTNPIAADARRARRERTLGPDAHCALCGLAQLETLVPTARRLLEAHHLVGRANDPALTVPLCRNCHAIETEGHRTAGVTLAPPATLLEKLVAILRALGAFLATLGGKLQEWAEQLAALLTALDQTLPDWRAVPEARP